MLSTLLRLVALTVLVAILGSAIFASAASVSVPPTGAGVYQGSVEINILDNGADEEIIGDEDGEVTIEGFQADPAESGESHGEEITADEGTDEGATESFEADPAEGGESHGEEITADEGTDEGATESFEGETVEGGEINDPETTADDESDDDAVDDGQGDDAVDL